VAAGAVPPDAGHGAAAWARAVWDLAAPVECGGCGRPRVRWCADCAVTLAERPLRVRTRADVRVPVWALARHGGPPATAVTAHKDRGRHDLAEPLGAALAAGVEALREAGELADRDVPLALVPAPASPRARRRRGYDHVRRICAAVAADLAGSRPPSPVAVAPLLEIRGRVADAAGLGAEQRARNLAGRVHRAGPDARVLASTGAPDSVAALLDAAAAGRVTVLLVDDVVTTGSTLASCCAALSAGGLAPHAALCVTAA